MNIPHNRPLDSLKTDCADQSARYLDKQPHDLSVCYEIFHRAVIEQEEAGWTVLFELYQAQIGRWLRRMSAFHYCEEELDSCINMIFWKFFRLMLPDKLAKFKGRVPALLQYLKKCTVSYVLDCGRRAKRPPEVPIDSSRDTSNKDRTAMDVECKEWREQIYQAINEVVKNDRERIMFEAALLQGLKSQQIWSLYPDHFKTVGEVYRVKENLMRRLNRNQKLGLLLENPC